MKITATILILLVAIEAILFMVLEIWGSTEMLQRSFGMSAEFLNQSEARLALANQGIYNGFIGGGLLFARFDFPVDAQAIGSLLFTSFVVLAGVFGMATIRRKSIFWIQAFPAILAVLAILFNV